MVTRLKNGLEKYNWLIILAQVVIIPAALWYATLIVSANEKAAEALKLAEDCNNRLSITCANFDSEKARLNHLWEKSIQNDRTQEIILQKLSSLETHIAYIKEAVAKEHTK